MEKGVYNSQLAEMSGWCPVVQIPKRNPWKMNENSHLIDPLEDNEMQKLGERGLYYFGLL